MFYKSMFFWKTSCGESGGKMKYYYYVLVFNFFCFNTIFLTATMKQKNIDTK